MRTRKQTASASRPIRKRAAPRRDPIVPTTSIHIWDWKEDPIDYIRDLFSTFGVRIRARDVDRRYPGQYIKALAKAHGLHVYDAPTAGGDGYGFILSDSPLTTRQTENIEADYWGEPDPWEDE